jgi:hypothetical protein
MQNEWNDRLKNSRADEEGKKEVREETDETK